MISTSQLRSSGRLGDSGVGFTPVSCSSSSLLSPFLHYYIHLPKDQLRPSRQSTARGASRPACCLPLRPRVEKSGNLTAQRTGPWRSVSAPPSFCWGLGLPVFANTCKHIQVLHSALHPAPPAPSRGFSQYCNCTWSTQKDYCLDRLCSLLGWRKETPAVRTTFAKN